MKTNQSAPYFIARSTIGLSGIVVFIILLSPVSLAQSMNYEINRLISSVGRNGCTFIRNGEKYRGREARDLLRTKREANEQLISSTEDFIEKIASKSATSGEPYLIQCRDQEEKTVNAWFTSLLEQHRITSTQSEDEK